jgi:hypothetical protein
MVVVLLSGQKLTLALLATITLEVVSFGAFAPFLALLLFSILPAILPSSPHLCQNGGISIGEIEKSHGQIGRVEWVGDNSHVVLRQKFPGEKGSVRQCVITMQQPVLLSPKYR